MKAAAYSCLLGSAIGETSPDVLAKFEEFRTKWGRTYTGEEYMKRVQYFEDHLHQIEKLQLHERGTATYTYLGPFADLSEDEISSRMGIVPQESFDNVPDAPLLNKTIGSSFDWVSKGAVNPIKNQGSCGSCWAFSTVANLEGVAFVTGGTLPNLSEQYLVDCDTSDDGCNGGLPSRAFMWIAKNGGIVSEKSYPYRGTKGTCHQEPKIVKDTSYLKISSNEDQIAQALVKYGPLSIAVDATPFQWYSGGILDSWFCSKTRIDHGVNIVGYGSGASEYFKVRNSWGSSWGEEGYIRIIRGKCMCALCTTVTTATGVTEISDVVV